MKINQKQMAVLALIVIGLLYLYNNPTVIYKNKPVYYPVYETEYVPVGRHINRGFRPDPRGRMPRPHPGHPGKDWHFGPDGKYLPAKKGGVIPFSPL